jgi:type VI secretion system secreted protein VgrG
MGLSQVFSLVIEGNGASFRVFRLKGRERIHAPFVFEVTCAPGPDAPAPIDAEAILTRAARLTWTLGDGNPRVVEGMVDRVEAMHGGLRLSIVPRVAELADAVNYRVFLQKDAAQIVEEVLNERQLVVERRLSRALALRPQCVQAFESDLAFVSRLLSEEGIAWWLRPGAEDTIVLSDRGSGHDDIPGEATLRVVEDAGLAFAESVTKIRLRAAVVSSKVSMRDFDFTHPQRDQSVDAGEGGRGLEIDTYPGGYTDPTEGRALARIRLEEVRAERFVLHAETSCRRLWAGHVVTLKGAARPDLNQRWLLVDVEHEAIDQGAGGDDMRYLARFTAVPADGGYRPPRPDPPRLGGVQTATVTGPRGAEIHTEAFGRVTAKLRWDRLPSRDERSSHWMRVVQPPTSGGFFLPRVGWEVLLGFSGAGADAPFVLGRLINGAAPPQHTLPASRVVSAFGTLTTPEGESSNAIVTDDTAGNEQLGLTASLDYKERTENDKVTRVAASDVYSIGGCRRLIVGTVHEVSVTGAQSSTIGGDREVNVGANKAISAAREAVSVRGARGFTIGGDFTTACAGSLTRVVGAAKSEVAVEHHSRTVAGNATISVGGSTVVAAGAHASVSVLGASVEEVGGAKNILCGKYTLSVTGALNEVLASRSVTAGGDRGEDFGATATYAIGGSAKLSGSDIVFKAKTRIILQADGATITITPSAITIDAVFDGSVASIDDGNVSYSG